MKQTNIFLVLIILILGTSFSSCTMKKNIEFADEKYKDYLRQLENATQAEKKKLAYDLVVEGAKFKMQNNFARAILEYNQALLYDTSAVILYEIADCYGKMYKYDMSGRYAAMAIKRDPELAEAYRVLSTALLMTYDSKGAIKAYKKYAEFVPSDNNIFTLAKMYEISGFYDEALHYYQELYDKTADAGILKNMAYLNLADSDTAKYLELSKRAYREAPEDSELIYDLMLFNLREHHYEENHDLLLDYSLYAPSDNFTEAYGANLEYMLDSLDNEQLKKHAPIYLESIDEKMKESEYITAFAFLISMRIEDSAKTEEYAEYAIEKFPGNPYFYKNAGIFYYQTNRFEKSAELYEKGLNQFPEDLDFRIMLSEVYVKLEKFDEAVSLLEEGLIYDSANVMLATRLGTVYHFKGDYRMSDSAFAEALALEPDNPVTGNEYAYFLAEREERLVYAQSLIRKSLSLKPDDPHFLDTYAWVAHKMGDYDTAIDFFNKAIDNFDGETPAIIYEHLGYTYKAKGNPEKARQYWQKALEAGSEDEDKIRKEIQMLDSEDK